MEEFLERIALEAMREKKTDIALVVVEDVDNRKPPIVHCFIYSEFLQSAVHIYSGHYNHYPKATRDLIGWSEPKPKPRKTGRLSTTVPPFR
ncbi:MAG: hypothetical protein QXI19_04060 [Candidatus Caldarchaeum sp.]